MTCSHRRPTRVVALSLPSSNLTGILSPAIGNLTFLRRLNLSFNKLYGEIPARPQASAASGVCRSSTSCVSLTSLVLSNNQLGGRIPLEHGNKITRLQMLALTNNSFTGPIPASLGR